MSEQDRSRLYAWLREQTDEPLAEYVMSCLSPVPVPDLVTKQHLETVLAAEFSAFALNMAAQREADREQYAAQRDADRARLDAQRESDHARLDAQRESDHARLDAQRESDRATAAKRHKVAMAAAIVLALEIAAAEAGWLGWLTDLLAGGF